MKAGWVTSTLGDTCEMYQPKTISGKEMVQDGAYPVFGANGIIGRYDQYNHEDPQLLITCRGATCGSVNISEPFSWITGNAMVVRPKSAEIDMRFLEYLFRGGIDISKAITGAAQPQITRTNLSPLQISYPTQPAEQQRIVAILDEAFAGIATARAAAEQNRQNARALFQSGYIEVFQQVVANGYRPTTVAEIAHPSKGSMRTGPFGSQLLHSEFVDDGVAVLGIDNAVNNEFRWDKRRYITQEKYSELSRYRVKPGDVIITIMGTCGRCAIVPDDIPLAINTKHLCCITLDPEKCIPEFLHGYFLYHPVAQGFLSAQAKGSIMAGLNMGIISALLVRLPSLAQQQEIADKVGVLQEETQRLEALYQRKLEALDELKQSLLHQAFSGAL